ncbi:MAG: DUF1592 domain-containing protein [Myxococcaceae bacterium]|nr:DUF1592 domain-containing protein [Myxococcaceae bacterium]
MLPPPVDETPRECRPVPSPMRALTPRQYDEIVADLLQDTSRPARDLEAPSSETRFDNHADWVSMDEVRLRFYLSSAEGLATRALTRQASVFPCAAPMAAQEEACVGQIFDTFGRRAWRRTLTADERTTLLGVFRTVRALSGATYNDALSAVLQVVLQSPQFLYVTEVGTPVVGATRPTSRLTPLETATKLSLYLWGTVPDVALLDAAEQGRLETKQDVEREVRRLLASPKAREGYLHFASQWLETEHLADVSKNATTFPLWSPDVSNAARAELETFIGDTYAGGKNYAALLTARDTSVNATLAPLYGVQAGATSLPASRAGVLTRVAWLAAHSHPEATSPTFRGKSIRTRMLCEEVSPPPPGVNVMLPNVTGPATIRQRLSVHIEAGSSCFSCHRLMDPIGFGLESYDGIGVSRTTDNGLPVDDRGEIVGGSTAGTFTGPIELSQRLADSPEANRCYLTQAYRYAQGRTETSRDRCHLDAAQRSLPAGASLQDVAVAITTSDAFLTRETLP